MGLKTPGESLSWAPRGRGAWRLAGGTDPAPPRSQPAGLSRGAHLGRCAGGRSRATGGSGAQLATTQGLRAHRKGCPPEVPRTCHHTHPACQGSPPCCRPSVLEPLSPGGGGRQQVSHLRPGADTEGQEHRAASPLGAGPSEGTASCRAAANPGRSPSPPALKRAKMPLFSSGAWKTFCRGTPSPHPGDTRRGSSQVGNQQRNGLTHPRGSLVPGQEGLGAAHGIRPSSTD